MNSYEYIGKAAVGLAAAAFLSWIAAWYAHWTGTSHVGVVAHMALFYIMVHKGADYKHVKKD